MSQFEDHGLSFANPAKAELARRDGLQAGEHHAPEERSMLQLLVMIAICSSPLVAANRLVGLDEQTAHFTDALLAATDQDAEPTEILRQLERA